MVTLRRKAGEPYEAVYGLEKLERVAREDNCLPLSLISESGNYIKETFLEYVLPLIGRLPQYTKLNRPNV